jgi:DNA-binding SARP family transcriptional activator
LLASCSGDLLAGITIRQWLWDGANGAGFVDGSGASFGVLGPLQVRVADLELGLARSSLRRLLGVLLLTPGEPVDRQQLVELVWGPAGCEPGTLHTAVSRLRGWLQEHTGLRDAIVLVGKDYRIDVPDDSVDAGRFRDLIHAAEREPDTRARVALLGSALSLWRGPVLSDCLDSARPSPVAAELERDRVDCACRLADDALACGHLESAIENLERLAAVLPYDELVHARLITLLGRSGRRAEGLRRFEGLRRRIADELGVDPSGPLREAHLELLRDEPPSAGPAICLLPPDLADFTGREEQLGHVAELLARRDDGQAVAMVAIAGMPGVGKTALAVHLAHRLSGQFPGGQLFVDLHGAEAHPADSAEVLARFLRALGVASAAIPETLEERAETYRALVAGQRLLVVLDNATDAEQIRPLLPGSGTCAVIVTSRTRLGGLHGMRQINLGVLDTESAVELLTRITGRDRTIAEPAQTQELARLCGYLPLALRIAGARLAARPHWPVGRLGEQLANEQLNPLSHLVFGSLQVRAGLALGYEGLDLPTRRLFRRLGLLAAPDFAAWTGAALLDTTITAAEELIERLVDAQLLETAGYDSTGLIRYRFHDLVRAFARERADAEETEAERRTAIAGALGCWLALTERAHRELWGGDFAIVHGDARRRHPGPAIERLVTGAPLSWYEAERLNIVAGVRQAAETGMHEMCWDLAVSAMSLFESRSHLDDWRDTHVHALSAVRRAGNSRGVAAVNTALALLYANLHRYQQAGVALQEAAGLFERLDERHGLALALGMVAYAEHMYGRFDSALHRFEQVRLVLHQVGDRGAEAMALRSIGHVHLDLGDAELAENYLNDALALIDDNPARAGHPRRRILYRLADVALAKGELDRAERLFTRLRDLAQEIHDSQAQAYALHGLGTIRLRQGMHHEAEAFLDDALSLARDVREHLHHARVLMTRSELDLERRRLDGAAADLTEAVAICQEIQSPLWHARALRTLGDVHEAAGDTCAAEAVRTEANTLFTQLGIPEPRTYAGPIRR